MTYLQSNGAKDRVFEIVSRYFMPTLHVEARRHAEDTGEMLTGDQLRDIVEFEFTCYGDELTNDMLALVIAATDWNKIATELSLEPEIECNIAPVGDDVYEYTIPSYYASAMVTGDVSGLEDEDIEALDAFTETVIATVGHAHPAKTIDAGFVHYHDMNNGGADCVKIYFIA